MTDWYSAVTENDSRSTEIPSRISGRMLVNDWNSLTGEWRAVSDDWSAPGYDGNSLSDG